MRFEPGTYRLIRAAYHEFGDDIATGRGGEIIVGTRIQPPAVFDGQLNLLRSLPGNEAVFVTMYGPGDTLLVGDFE